MNLAHSILTNSYRAGLGMLVAGLLLTSAHAQDPPAPAPPEPEAASQAPADPEPQRSGGWRRFGEPRDAGQQGPASSVAPSQLILPAGAFLSIRVDQELSSDRNQPGDTFTATLTQPLIADGFVVARRGQTVGGRVAEAVKAGRRKGTSRLGIEITELSLVDGRQIPVVSQLMEYSGGTSKGRDATAIAGTTALGAAIGGAASGGAAAGIGAAAGAAASVIGVLATRGRATEIYAESVLTFRTMQPITITTERATGAFQPVEQGDYEPRTERRQPTLQRRSPAWYPGWWGSTWWGYGGPGWYGPGWYGPGYFGTSVLINSGPRFHRGGSWGRRGRW
ncbi:MAG: hypothetical protein JNK48_24955 [Bryobacterales bacterium]|nr:hypothetical protein [Bryobacterales bacterium]